MAVINCPKCQGKLHFPDDSPLRRVKCPSCSHFFIAGPNGPVGDGNSGVIEKTKSAPPKSSKASSSHELLDLDEEEERPRSKRRIDEDDDDRPRVRRRDEDEEDDDRPRSRRRDEEDDDEDDRPRSKRRSRNEEDDDEPPSKRRGRDEYEDRTTPKQLAVQFRNARQGVSLLGIGLWCEMGACAAMLLIFLLARLDVYSADLMALAGLPGIASWILAVIGCSFLVAGPKKGNLLGLSIALVAVAGIHLVLVCIVAFERDSSIYGYGYGGSSVNWHAMVTEFDMLMAMILYGRVRFLNLFCALLELAQFILLMLTLKEICQACKDRATAKKAKSLLILMPSGLGLFLVVYLLMKLIFENTAMGSGGRYIYYILQVLQYGGYIAIFAFAALLCGGTKEAIAYRKR